MPVMFYTRCSWAVWVKGPMLALGSSKVEEALLDEIHKEEKEKKTEANVTKLFTIVN